MVVDPILFRSLLGPSIIQVDWIKPPCGWIKCNSDGASRGNPGEASCGAIFRDSSGAILGCMADFIGIETSFRAELIASMISIETAYHRGWWSLWLECDSLLVVQSFSNQDLIPWKYKNRWRNCIGLTKKMRFHVSHIHREGNSCADKLASYGIQSHSFTWWDLPPSFISEDFFRNRFSLPYFRFRP